MSIFDAVIFAVSAFVVFALKNEIKTKKQTIALYLFAMFYFLQVSYVQGLL